MECSHSHSASFCHAPEGRLQDEEHHGPSLGVYRDREKGERRYGSLLQKYPLSACDLWVPGVTSLAVGQSDLRSFLYVPCGQTFLAGLNLSSF